MSHKRVTTIDRHLRDVVIAVNPKAGARDTAVAAERLQEELRSLGLAATIESDIETISNIARHRSTLRAVVAAGGDGTVALLANRLPPQTHLAILPQGTENLLAKYLQIPHDPHHVAQMIDQGLGAELDAGRANGQLFLVMASCGFDAEVVHQVHKQRRGNIRHLAYAKPILRSIRKYRYPTVSIFCNDSEKPIRAKWAFVFNIPRYAMGLPIASDADGLDGKLDLCAFRGGNLMNGLIYLFGILARQHRRWRDTLTSQAKRFRLQADEQVPYQLDGDPGGFLPLEIEVVPKRLKMIVPKSWATQHNLIASDGIAVNG